MPVATETPLQGARRRAALAAIEDLADVEGQLERARRARAAAFAQWHSAGASYGTMVTMTGLGRSTIIDIVRWGNELTDDAEASHPRSDRT